MLLRHAILIGSFVCCAQAIGQPQGPSAEPISRGTQVTAQTIQFAQILEQARALAQERVASINDGGTTIQQRSVPGQYRSQDLQSDELTPRQPLSKVPSDQLRAPLEASGRLIVKFMDDVKARVQPNGLLVSLSGRDLTAVRDIVQNAGFELTPAIRLPGESIAFIEGKAAANSGKAQPDLAGLMYVTAAEGGAVPMQLAQALNDLDIVEFVEIEPKYLIKRPEGPTGACCLDDGVGNFTICQVLDAATCAAMGGVYNGDGTECPDPDDPACGDLCGGDCFLINNTPICDDEECCDLICELDPFCCELDATWPGRGPPRWDAYCVEQALALCDGLPPDSVCGNPNAGPCMDTHPETVGCSNEGCCAIVCDVEPQCCTIAWDGLCAEVAFDLCAGSDPNGETPSLVRAQGYLSSLGYVAEYGFIPPEIAPALGVDVDGFLLDGFQGQGYDLQGLWEIGQFLVDHDIGSENLTRGKSMKVGIVEFSAFVSSAIGPAEPYRHEDLHGKVIPEPGQTPIILPQSLNLDGHHGTATLGIVGAIDNDADGNVEPDGLSPDQSRAEEVGVVGIAPEADLYFFPIVSVEEPGGRLISAIASAMLLFQPGDVLSFSIGPAGCGVLTSGAASWLMIRAASDLGITCCISAGNDCCDLSENPQDQGDSGAIIVGACYPGRGAFNVYCRLGFSNHCLACGDGDAVHVSAWGTAVATIGWYGTMFFPNGDLNRSYANSFGGTSAAAPQVAGLVANLQGLAKQFYGIPLLTSQIRGIVSGNGWGQCGYIIPDDRPGNDADRPCLGDWDFDASKNHITDDAVGYTEAVTAAASLISSPFFDCDSQLQSFDIFRGGYLYGNLNSLRCPDGQLFRIKSQYTEPLDNISRGIVYLGYGHVTDIMVGARPEVQNPQSISLNIVSNFIPLGSSTSYLNFGELYDFQQNRWVLVGFDAVDLLDLEDDEPPFLFTYVPLQGAAPFIRGDNLVLIRVWTLTIGGNFGGFGGAGANASYVIEHDWIGIGVGGIGDDSPGQ